MKKYENIKGLLCFSLGGKDYVTNKGDALELPEDDDYTKRLLLSGCIQESTKDVKPPKTDKNEFSTRS